MHNCFLKLFEVNIIPSHCNQPSSLSLDWLTNFCIKRKSSSNWLTHSLPMDSFSIPWKHQNTVRFLNKWVKIQSCEVKMSLMRVRLRTPATSKMEIFLAVVKERMLTKVVTNSSILDVTVVLDPVWVNSQSSFL